jgi:hypothetical protein
MKGWSSVPLPLYRHAITSGVTPARSSNKVKWDGRLEDLCDSASRSGSVAVMEDDEDAGGDDDIVVIDREYTPHPGKGNDLRSDLEYLGSVRELDLQKRQSRKPHTSTEKGHKQVI